MSLLMMTSGASCCNITMSLLDCLCPLLQVLPEILSILMHDHKRLAPFDTPFCHEISLNLFWWHGLRSKRSQKLLQPVCSVTASGLSSHA